MHELGVVFNVIKTCEEVAEQNHISDITAVTLRIGTVSTVVPALLTDCWNWAVKRTQILKNACLNIERIEAVTFCEDCKQEYDTVKHGKTCPFCGSTNTYLLQGNEFEIKDIETQDDLPDIPEDWEEPESTLPPEKEE